MVRDYNRIPEYRAALPAAISGMLRNIGDDALEAIDKGFEQGTAPNGEPWAPLAPSTIEQTGPEILIDEGDLRESFEMQVRTSPVGPQQLVVYSEDEKLKYHEFGTEKMPRRPIMDPLARELDANVLPDALDTAAKTAERKAGIVSLF